MDLQKGIKNMVHFIWHVMTEMLFFSIPLTKVDIHFGHVRMCATPFRSTCGFDSSKSYDKRNDFDFDIVNFPFLDGDVHRRASYGVYISQLVRFARVCNNVTDFNPQNKCLTAKLLQHGYRYHKLRNTFSNFYCRHYELMFTHKVGLKTLLGEGLSEQEFYGDLVYKFKKLI